MERIKKIPIEDVTQHILNSMLKLEFNSYLYILLFIYGQNCMLKTPDLEQICF